VHATYMYVSVGQIFLFLHKPKSLKGPWVGGGGGGGGWGGGGGGGGGALFLIPNVLSSCSPVILETFPKFPKLFPIVPQICLHALCPEYYNRRVHELKMWAIGESAFVSIL